MSQQTTTSLPLDEILQGDCLDLLEDIPEKSIDHIITDPPYFLPAQHYGTRKTFRRNFSDLGILESFFKQFFRQIDRILKEDGFLYLFCDGQSYPVLYYHTFPIFKSVRPLIWDKKVSFSGYHYRHQHEIILFGIRENSPIVPTGEGDILRYNAVKIDERVHPAEKPIDLLQHLIQKTSKENDIILDPCCGGGSVLAAAHSLKRHYIGFDTNPEYVKVAEEHIKKHQEQGKLLTTL